MYRPGGGEEGVFRVRMPRGKEVLGVIEALLGTNRLQVRCQDNRMRMCRIPGKMRKRVWMKEGDIVIIEPWDIQGDKNGNVTWRYSPTEAGFLRRKGVLRL